MNRQEIFKSIRRRRRLRLFSRIKNLGFMFGSILTVGMVIFMLEIARYNSQEFRFSLCNETTIKLEQCGALPWKHFREIILPGPALTRREILEALLDRNLKKMLDQGVVVHGDRARNKLIASIIHAAVRRSIDRDFKRNSRAAALLEKALGLDPSMHPADLARTYAGMGDCYFSKRKYLEAYKYYKMSATRLAPTDQVAKRLKDSLWQIERHYLYHLKEYVADGNQIQVEAIIRNLENAGLEETEMAKYRKIAQTALDGKRNPA